MATTVRMIRSGGVAGITMTASVDVDDLPAEAAARARSALAGLNDPPAAATPAGRPSGSDRFQYDVTVETDGKKRSFMAHDGGLTPAQQVLVDILLPLARPE